MSTASSRPSTRTDLSRRIHGAILSTAVLCTMVTASWSVAPVWALGQKHTLTTENGTTIALTTTGEWTAQRQANVTRFIRARAEAFRAMDPDGRAGIPQMTITTDDRTDHAEAVRRLAEIALERPVPPNYIEIGGWPALQRRFRTQRPQAGGLPSGSKMVMQVTTAVAVGSQLVRMETWLSGDADEPAILEVETIGRSLVPSVQGDPASVTQEIENLKNGIAPGGPLSILPPQGIHNSALSMTPGTTISEPASASKGSIGQVPAAGLTSADGASVRVANTGVRDSELEIAVSPNGRNVVMGTNNLYFFSNNGGQTWASTTEGLNGNDPSLAWGPSGTFYAANIASPSTGMSVSTNNGQTFAFRSNVYTCGQAGDPACGAAFPDQEHIAADQFNVTATGDQVYSAWRHLDGNWGIVCSNDNGTTWSTNGFFSGGDFPRITVGQDGFVYVTYQNGNNIQLRRFTSCETNQNPMVAGPVRTVAAASTDVACPTPGLDRCNFRNILASPQPAVDDLDASHIYVAYAVNTSPGGGGSPVCANQNTCDEDVVVQDSVDGGVTWNAADPDRTAIVNSGVTARRFMPWVCAVGGVAHVAWYDRRAATPANNSLTDFYRGSAYRDLLGDLVSGSESKVNAPGSTDAQCEAGAAAGSTNSWPSVVDQPGDSESCSNQPQPGGFCCDTSEIDGSGRCLMPTGLSSRVRCDFSSAAGVGTAPCGMNESCAAQRGSPKYGDYNGTACAAGRLYMGWASATAPPSLPASTDIDAFFSSSIVCCVPQITVPGSVFFDDTCLGSTSHETMDVCNTGKEDLEVASIASSSPRFAVQNPSSGYPVVISPDFCFPFTVNFTPTTTTALNETLTITSDDPMNPSVAVAVSGRGITRDIDTVIADSGSFGDVCRDTIKDLPLTIHNSGGCDLSVSNITSSAAEFQVASAMSYPVVVAPGTSLQVPIRLAPTTLGAKAGNITVTSNDPDTPLKVVAVTGTTPPGDIRVTGSTDFGDVCAGTQAEKTVSVCNVGKCNLNVTSVDFEPACLDFTLINNPFPAPVSPDSCESVVIRFTPTSAGPKSCTLVIRSDDPDMPVISKTVTANTPLPMIDVPPDQGFPPTVISSVGACNTGQPFPVSNTGTCNLSITNFAITTNTDEYSLSGLPSFPIILLPGHIAGEGDLQTVFAPDVLARSRVGTLEVTYVSDPITGATTNVLRAMCGEGVRTGARVLVTSGGVPLLNVEQIKLTRINANRNRNLLDTVDNARNLIVQTVSGVPPCATFQYHREYSTVSNQVQLLPGSYQVTVTAIVNGKRTRKTVGFDVTTCDFNPAIVVNF